MDVLGWDAPRDRTKGGVNGMDLLAHCEHGVHWSSNCVKCRARATTGYDFVSLQRDEARSERDAARDQLREAVDALRFYADEANWKLHVTPSGWSSAAAADDGERARAALRGQ
jgi:hypothetical protein